jgi:hypothetical protein
MYKEKLSTGAKEANESVDRVLSSRSPRCSTAPEYFKRCGDCGQFVGKDRWVRQDNTAGKTHALCSDCLSNYDGPEYH